MACIAVTVFSTPVYAMEYSYRDSIRESKTAPMVSFKTKRPYAEVKACVIGKAYEVRDRTNFYSVNVNSPTTPQNMAGFIKEADQKTETVKVRNGTGELIHWGDSNPNSIELELVGGITEVRLRDKIITGAREMGKNRIVPVQPFSFYNDCFKAEAAAAVTGEVMPGAIYTLTTQAKPIQLADCLFNGGMGGRTSQIFHNIDGTYRAQMPTGYSRTDDEVRIAPSTEGARAAWKGPAQTAFAVIKLYDPAKNFDRETAEKNHPQIRALKQCSDIVEGRSPRIMDSQQEGVSPAERVRSKMAERLKNRLDKGEIQMAEMPLMVMPLPATTQPVSVRDRELAKIPVRFVAAAKVAKGKDNAKIWPAVVLQPKSGNVKFDLAMMNDRAAIAYCDEDARDDFIGSKAMPTITCYQDLDGDSSFETERRAVVRQPWTVADIYFMESAITIAPQPYTMAADNEIPITYLKYWVYDLSGKSPVCTSYISVARKNTEPGFCFILPKKTVDPANPLKSVYDLNGIKVSAPTEAKNSDLVSIIESIPAGTVIGSVEPREPFSTFGSTPRWLEQFLANSAAPLQGLETYKESATPALDKVGGSITVAHGGAVMKSRREPFRPYTAKTNSISGNGFTNGEKLKSRRINLDGTAFEPGAVLTCAERRAGYLCIIANRSTRVGFNFDSIYSLNQGRYSGSVDIPETSTTPRPIDANEIDDRTLLFHSWSSGGFDDEVIELHWVKNGDATRAPQTKMKIPLDSGKAILRSNDQIMAIAIEKMPDGSAKFTRLIDPE
jgi:hypothetical protein